MLKTVTFSLLHFQLSLLPHGDQNLRGLVQGIHKKLTWSPAHIPPPQPCVVTGRSLFYVVTTN